MNAFDFTPYIGHSSTYPALDSLLKEHGITWRPSAHRNLDTLYFIPGKGISIAFTIGAENEGIHKKSDGDFILDQLEVSLVEENKKHGKYAGTLPLGLSASDSRQQTRRKLGVPTRTTDKLDNYYIDQLVWTLAFDGDHLKFVQVAAPSDGKRKHGLCP
ncbi:hypothetical protein [Luteimonas sp. e5]